MRMKSSTRRHLEGSLFIAPWFIGFLIFMAIPLVFTLYMSFHYVAIQLGTLVIAPAGFGYYDEILFKNANFLYKELFPFLRTALMMIPIIIIFSLTISILLNQDFRGRGIFRALFFLPVIFTTGQLITEFMNSDSNKGGIGLNFLSEYDIAGIISANLSQAWSVPILSVMEQFVLILWYSGVQIIIFLAGRQTISKSIYEAARIDGANPWEAFWKITLPSMMPFIFLNVIYTIIDLFTHPANPILAKVNTINYGFSSALSWIYFVIIFLFLSIVLLVFALINHKMTGGEHK